jgi:hypothetical protein
MKAQHLNQAGFGHMAVVFLILFVSVAGFAGYKVVSMNKTAGSSESSATASPKVPEKINTKADLNVTAKALDNSSAQLNGSLNDSSLDADLNDML